MMRKLLYPIAFLVLGALPLLAQSAPPNGNPPGQMRNGRQEPCWQQAGIEKSVMEQRWSLERDTRSQVEAVCSNSSLTPQQKRQQVKEIRQQAHQKMEGLVTADQEKALTSCQQARGMNHPGGGSGAGAHDGAGGGCGEWQGSRSHPGGSPNGAPGNSNGGTGNPPPSNPPPSNPPSQN